MNIPKQPNISNVYLIFVQHLGMNMSQQGKTHYWYFIKTEIKKPNQLYWRQSFQILIWVELELTTKL